MNDLLKGWAKRLGALDKVAHAMGCALIFAAIYDPLRPLGVWTAAAIALAAVAVVAWAKERADERHPKQHTKDWWDARAGLLGGLGAALYMVLIAPLIRLFLW